MSKIFGIVLFMFTSILFLQQTAKAQALSVTATNTDILCNGQQSTVTALGSGGVAPYNYSIDGVNFSSNDIFTVNAGTYTVSVQDAASTLATTVISITQPSVITATVNVNSPMCFGQANGSMNALASGGTPFQSPFTFSYVYDWFDENFTQVESGDAIANITSGNYILQVEDYNGCIYNQLLTVTQPAQLGAIVTIQQPFCYGDSTGQISVQATGGTVFPSPTFSFEYVYDWFDLNFTQIDTGAVLSNVETGSYILQIEDYNGCIYNETVVVNQPDSISVSIAVTGALCHDDLNGTATAIASGGSPFQNPYPYAYIYDWYDSLNNQISNDSVLSNFGSGYYSLHVEDFNGCFNVFEGIFIPNPDTIAINVNVTNPLCYAGLGSAVSVASGGTPFFNLPFAYLYDWYDSSYNLILNDSVLSNAGAGNYLLVVEDYNGCLDSAFVTITQPALITSSVTVVDCDSTQLPYGLWVYASGVFVHTYPNIIGCDSVVTYNVTINYTSAPSVVNQTACDSLTLPYGQVVTVSGNYVHTYTNISGCDSMVTYATIINYSSTPSTVNLTSCDSLQLPYGLTVYTSGLYSHTYTNVSGCDSLVSYNTTIHYSSTPQSVSVVSCDSTALPFGQTVYVSGSYPHTYSNLNGCDSIVTYMVTINYTSVPQTINITNCDSLLLPYGATVYVSGLYTHTYTNITACDSTVSYNVTINYSSAITNITDSNCNFYNLPWGSTVTTSGVYSHTYTNTIGCDSVVVFNVTIITTPITFTVSGTNLITNDNLVISVTDPTDGISYDISGPGGLNTNDPDLITQVTSVNSGVYTITVVGANGCTGTTYVTVNVSPRAVLSLKAILSGPFVASAGLMHDSLRVQGNIPLTEPYGTLNSVDNPYTPVFTHVNGNSGQTIGASLLNVSGNNAIVDWVFLQLRSAANNAVVLETQSALIQRDGDVVSASDGLSPVVFANSVPGNYFVTIKHRNHLGNMSASPIALGEAPTNVNFTNGSTTLFLRAVPNNNPSPLTGATRNIGGVRAMYAGNCNITPLANARFISYSALASADRTALFNATGGTGTITGYTIFDVDLNGSAKFNGLNPDRFVILTNCANSNAINVQEQTPN